MAGLLGIENKDSPDTSGPDSVIIGDVEYHHTAAKFWPSLLDEVMVHFPACTSIELFTVSPEKLGEHHLFPKLAFCRELERLLHVDMDKVMAETLAEIEMLGPPPSVNIRLISSGTELLHQEMPRDCLDAGILSYLIAWMLKWAKIEVSSWNDPVVPGSFEACDPANGHLYAMFFTLLNEHLSEGVFKRSFTLRPIAPYTSRPMA